MIGDLVWEVTSSVCSYQCGQFIRRFASHPTPAIHNKLIHALKTSIILHRPQHMLRGRDERSVLGWRMVMGSPMVLRYLDDPGPI